MAECDTVLVTLVGGGEGGDGGQDLSLKASHGEKLIKITAITR